MNTRLPAALMATVTLVFLALASAGTASAQESNMKKMTPVLLVEEVEPCLAVWERLGFEKTMEVPERTAWFTCSLNGRPSTDPARSGSARRAARTSYSPNSRKAMNPASDV